MRGYFWARWRSNVGAFWTDPRRIEGCERLFRRESEEGSRGELALTKGAGSDILELVGVAVREVQRRSCEDVGRP